MGAKRPDRLCYYPPAYPWPRGLLIVLRGDVPQVAAEARTNQKTVEVVRGQESVTPDAMPESLLRIAIRTRQNLIQDGPVRPNDQGRIALCGCTVPTQCRQSSQPRA
jgi:hypothetical protein